MEKRVSVLFNDVWYFFYITNAASTPTDEIVFLANKRCDQENLIEQLKNGVKAMRMPVDNLVSNWAYMVMASLAWTLKAWFALLLPEKGRWKQKYRRQKQEVHRMQFKPFVNTLLRLPRQLVRSGRRRVYRLLDTAYVGSAGELYAWGDGAGPAAPLVFVRAGPDTTSVGLMTGAIREVSTRLATVTVAGPVRRARIVDGRLWVVSDQRIAAYPISGERLLDPVVYEIAGVRDLAFIDGSTGRAAVAGVFGRAILRFGLDGTVRTESEHREAAGLVRAHCDGRYVVASGPFGSWQYDTTGTGSIRPRMLDGATTGPAVTATEPAAAATLSGSASISADGRSVRLPGGEQYTEPGSPTVTCLTAVEGELWVGHDAGITVLGMDGMVLGRLRLDGPVRFIFPLSGGGAAWVSEGGGFGSARRTLPADE